MAAAAVTRSRTVPSHCAELAHTAPGMGAALLADMGTADLSKLWLHVAVLEALPEDPLAPPIVVPHEETDLHRVFCDERFCLEHGPRAE